MRKNQLLRILIICTSSCFTCDADGYCNYFIRIWSESKCRIKSRIYAATFECARRSYRYVNASYRAQSRHKSQSEGKSVLHIELFEFIILILNYIILFIFCRMASRHFTCAHKRTKLMLPPFLLKMVLRLMLKQRYAFILQ